MPLQRMQEITSISIPNFTCTIIAAGDEPITIFIKPTVSQRQNMCFQSLE